MSSQHYAIEASVASYRVEVTLSETTTQQVVLGKHHVVNVTVPQVGPQGDRGPRGRSGGGTAGMITVRECGVTDARGLYRYYDEVNGKARYYYLSPSTTAYYLTWIPDDVQVPDEGKWVLSAGATTLYSKVGENPFYGTWTIESAGVSPIPKLLLGPTDAASSNTEIAISDVVNLQSVLDGKAPVIKVVEVLDTDERLQLTSGDVNKGDIVKEVGRPTTFRQVTTAGFPSSGASGVFTQNLSGYSDSWGRYENLVGGTYLAYAYFEIYSPLVIGQFTVTGAGESSVDGAWEQTGLYYADRGQYYLDIGPVDELQADGWRFVDSNSGDVMYYNASVEPLETVNPFSWVARSGYGTPPVVEVSVPYQESQVIFSGDAWAICPSAGGNPLYYSQSGYEFPWDIPPETWIVGDGQAFSVGTDPSIELTRDYLPPVDAGLNYIVVNPSELDNEGGYVPLGQLPLIFSATRNGVSPQSGGQVQWSVELDTTGGFSAHQFVVPSGMGGLWMFNASVYFQVAAANVVMELGIYVNYDRVRAFYGGPFELSGARQGQQQVFGIIPLSSGDVVKVHVIFFYGSGTVRSDSGVNWFVGVKL